MKHLRKGYRPRYQTRSAEQELQGSDAARPAFQVRALSLVAAFAMAFSLMPIGAAFAEEPVVETEVVAESEAAVETEVAPEGESVELLAAPPSASIKAVQIVGFKDKALAATTATITINGDKLASDIKDLVVTDWVENYLGNPIPAGITVKANAAKDGHTITLTFAGTPTETGSGYFEVSIPSAYLEKSDLPLSAYNEAAIYNIGAYAAPGGLTAVAGNHRAKISWTAVDPGAGNTLLAYEYNITPIVEGYSYYWQNGGDEPTLSLDGLSNGIAYYVSVRAYIELADLTTAYSQAATTTVRPTTVPRRLGGADRYETAALASQEFFTEPDYVDTVIVSDGANFPDALAASTLAGVTEAPILLTSRDALHAATKAEIERLSPSKIYITGQAASISADVEAALNKLAPTERLGGANRYETAALIAKKAADEGEYRITTAFLATGEKFADSVSISPIAYNSQSPVLLTAKDGLSASTKSALTDLGITSVTILGDENSVSKAVANELSALKISVDRLGGSDRYETSKLINQKFRPSGGDIVGIASGENFPDALAGGAAVGYTGLPLYADEGSIILTPQASLAPGAAEYLNNIRTSNPQAYIFGGTPSVSDSVAGTIGSILTPGGFRDDVFYYND